MLLALKSRDEALLALVVILSSLVNGVVIFFVRSISREIGSYFSLGLGEGAFIAFLGAATLFWGAVLDRVERRTKVVLVSLELAGVSVIITSFARTAAEYALSRGLTGFFLAVVVPFLVAMLADLRRAGERILAFMIFSILGTIGTALGFAVCLFAQRLATWRTMMRVVAIVQMCGCALIARIREPERGASENYLRKLRALSHGRKLRLSARSALASLRVRTNLLLIAQGFFGSMPWGAFALFFVHAIAEKLGGDLFLASIFVAATQATYLLAPSLAWRFDRIRARGRLDLIPLCSGFLMLIYASLFQAIISTEFPRVSASDPLSTLVAIFVRAPAEMLLFVILSLMFPLIAAQVGPIVNSILADVNTPETRAWMRGVLTHVENTARAIGAAVCGLLIDMLGDFSLALRLVSLSWYVGALFWFAMLATYRRDVETVELRVFELMLGSHRAST